MFDELICVLRVSGPTRTRDCIVKFAVSEIAFAIHRGRGRVF